MELNQKNMKKLLFLIAFAILLFWGVNHGSLVQALFQRLFSVLSPFLIGLALAFLLNVLLRPLERLWERLFLKNRGKKPGSKAAVRLKRPLCLLLDALLVTGFFFVLSFLIVPEIRRTIVIIAGALPGYLEQLSIWWQEAATTLDAFNIVLPQPEWNPQAFGSLAADFLSKSGQAFFNRTVDLTASLFSGIFNVLLGLVFAFYVLSQKEALGRQAEKIIRAYLPSQNADSVLAFFALSNKTFTNFVTGQLTEAVIIGALCFTGMLLFGMPYAPAISVLVGFTALIPVFGAFIGTAVGAFLILMVSPVKALWFVLFIVILQQLEGDFIYPKVVGKSVGLPGIWVLAAVTLGGSLMGIWGMLFGVPVCSVLYSLLRQSVNRRLEKTPNR